MDIKSTAATEKDTIVHPGTSGATNEIAESAITCPSCNYTGESEFLTCPSCGLIIKKYLKVKSQRINAAALSTSSEASEAGETTKSRKKALLVVCSLAITLLGLMFYRVNTDSTSSDPANSTPSPSAPAPNSLATNAPLTNPPAATVSDNTSSNLEPPPPDPNAQVSVEARSQYVIEKQALDAATELGTSAALDEFISNYPNSDWIHVAIYRRDFAALNEAKNLGTRAAFEEFLRKYPTSEWAEKARYRRDYAALNEAKSLGTRAAFEEFLRKYPTSEWAEKARYYRDYGAPAN